MSKTLTAEDFLAECDYISQDGDTVYIDEEAIIECMKQYAHYINVGSDNQSSSDD